MTNEEAGIREHRDDLALRKVLSIAQQLGISQIETAMILNVPVDSLQHWQNAVTRGDSLACPAQVSIHMGHVLGIWRCLVTLFPTPANRAAWLRQANTSPALQGRSPIDLITSGDETSLAKVRQYLQQAAS